MTVVSLTVLVWTVVAIIGIAVASWALIDSYIDRRALRRSGHDGASAAIVRHNLRSGHASLFLHAFFFFLGIRAFVVPPVSSAAGFAIASLGFIIVASINVRAVGLNQWERVQMRRAASKSVLP